MRAWLRKWYGDSCPFWTWPVTAFGITVLIVVPLFMIHSDWGVLAVYSIQLGVPAGFVLQQWWRRSLKKKLRRRVTRWLRSLLVPQSGVSSSQNLCGAGGQSFRPMTKLWSDDVGISLIIPHEHDRMLWMLTWNDSLPTPEELNAI